MYVCMYVCVCMCVCVLFLVSGDAYFYDKSVRRDLDLIRMVLGVCPQHDVLWGDLTALEHMQLFGSLKGLSKELMTEEIMTLLQKVQLDKVRV